MHRKPTTAYHHGDLRAALVAIARQALAGGEYDALSLRELARLAGVSANAPYRHFSSKSELLALVAAEGFRELGECFDRLRLTEPRKRLCRMADVYTDFARRNPALYRVMFGVEKTSLKEFADFAAAAGACFARLVAATASARGAAGGSPDPGIVRDAHAIWSIVHGWSRLDIDGVVGFLPPATRAPASLTVSALLDGWGERAV